MLDLRLGLTHASIENGIILSSTVGQSHHFVFLVSGSHACLGLGPLEILAILIVTLFEFFGDVTGISARQDRSPAAWPEANGTIFQVLHHCNFTFISKGT